MLMRCPTLENEVELSRAIRRLYRYIAIAVRTYRLVLSEPMIRIAERVRPIRQVIRQRIWICTLLTRPAAGIEIMASNGPTVSG